MCPVPCTLCTAFMSVNTNLVLFPGFMLILVGPHAAVAVEDGSLSVTLGGVVGICVLLAAGWLGYCLSSANLIRHRYVPHSKPIETDGASPRR